MSNLIKKSKILTVYVKEGATAEELKEVKRLVSIGWTSKPCKAKAEKDVIPHEVTKEFNISYDKVRKTDMYEYITKFIKEPNALKQFAEASHKKVNGEVSLNKNGEPKYNQLAAKRYFFKTYFPDRWVEIEKKLEDRKFKTSTAKKMNEIEKELLALL